MFTKISFLLSALGCGLLLAGAPATPADGPAIREHSLTVISGQPRERGRSYGTRFREQIRAFLNREIYQAFNNRPATRADMHRYAAACAGRIKAFAPIIYDELQGMAEGAGLPLDEVVLITLHEELYHRGALPPVEHCTAVAVGPPDTGDGHTYVGQTWDWMKSVAGLSSVLLWKRDEGPSVLAYSYPGLWVGAGLNSAGLALCWTSAGLDDKTHTARVGIPSYVLLAHLLYQDSLEQAVAEARRATHAGWFTFVLADGKGNLVNIEGSPTGLVVERHKGRLVRVLFGSREMTGTPPGRPVALHPRCRKAYDLLAADAGKIGRGSLQALFQDPRCGISVGRDTLDMMVFDATDRTALVSCGPAYGATWKAFDFRAK
jgi:isopenicillin-N N-acyltransferase-like protein